MKEVHQEGSPATVDSEKEDPEMGAQMSCPSCLITSKEPASGHKRG